MLGMKTDLAEPHIDQGAGPGTEGPASGETFQAWGASSFMFEVSVGFLEVEGVAIGSGEMALRRE